MISIFNPVKVFKDEFSSSWSSNIKTSKNGSNKIPINKNTNPPTLVLDAMPSVEYFSGVLPINRDWKETDLSSYKHLKFNISTSKTEYPDVKVIMVSKKDDIDVDSNSISLAEYGLMEGCEQEFIIPIEEFKGDGFDNSKVRTIKFIGGGNFSTTLSGIVIE